MPWRTRLSPGLWNLDADDEYLPGGGVFAAKPGCQTNAQEPGHALVEISPANGCNSDLKIVSPDRKSFLLSMINYESHENETELFERIYLARESQRFGFY